MNSLPFTVTCGSKSVLVLIIAKHGVNCKKIFDSLNVNTRNVNKDKPEHSSV